MRKVGILGGTFDPPHIGHLIIAEEVRIALQLEEIWFIPTSTPPHKQEANSDSRHRLKMTELAIESNPYFKSNDMEIERAGKSYTIDTVKDLQRLHPNCIFYFIIGADMVEYLPNWHQIDELASLVQFVGVKRSGYKLKSPYDILTVDIPLIDVSSTQLRKWLKENRSVNYIVPHDVYAYIKGEGLYGHQPSN